MKTVACLHNIKAMYQSMTIRDVLDAYSHFDFRHGSIRSCIDTSGQMAPPPFCLSSGCCSNPNLQHVIVGLQQRQLLNSCTGPIMFLVHLLPSAI